ncbi:MAG: chaperone NapD [Gammaproteobacteria bacterium]|nr:chaperone NapD [Gammaproteobacteria bacterium]
MNLSAILVLLRVDRFAQGVAMLAEQPGIEVHHQEPATGRVILVQEAPSVHEEVDGLKAIKALPGVIFAELVYHYFEEDTNLQARPPADLDSYQGLGAVPEYLNAP